MTALPRDARGRFLPRNGFPEQDRDPVTGRFVKAPKLRPTQPVHPEWKAVTASMTASHCPNCHRPVLSQQRGVYCDLCAPLFERLRTCNSCWHVHAPGDPCVVADAERAGDYDSHTIAADPFLEPGPTMGLWARIRRTLGW